VTNFWVLVAIAALAGIAVTLQSQFMGAMSQSIGTLESVFITYGSGGLLVGVVMLWLRGGNLSAWQRVPAYTLTSGLLGLIIVGAIGYATARLGLITTFTIILASQFLLAALLDQFGLLGATVRPLDWTKMFGVFVVLFGVWLIVK
jgi:transporter family-2 protein